MYEILQQDKTIYLDVSLKTLVYLTLVNMCAHAVLNPVNDVIYQIGIHDNALCAVGSDISKY